MDRFPASEDNNFSIWKHAVPWYFLATILVIFYVNTFAIWAWTTQLLGREAPQYLPFLILAILLASCLAPLRRVQLTHRRLLLLGIGIAVASIFLTDPEYPAKRIHVPQYMLLAIVLRRALSFEFARDPWLSIASTALAVLYAFHDEFLQGFHPYRTFGLRDILIDSLGAVSGSLIGAGSAPLKNTPAGAPLGEKMPFPYEIAYILIAAFLLVLPLEGYRDQLIPAWVTLPLLAAAVATAVTASGRVLQSAAFRVFACVGFSLLLYPLVSHVPTLHFH